MLMADAGIVITPSVGEMVLQAVEDALNRFDDKPAIAYRSRTDAANVEEAEVGTLVISSSEETSEDQGETIVHRRTVSIEVSKAGAPPADKLLDPLVVYAVLAIFTYEPLGALILGGHVARIQWDVEGGEQDSAFAIVDLVLTYQTERDPTVQFRPQDS